MYLMKKAGFPFTAADVRKVMGLDDDRFDLLIDAAIASICNMSTKPVRAETWAIVEGGGYERYGTPITITGPVKVNSNDRRDFMLCTYAPDPEAVQVALMRVVAWCKKNREIDAAIAAATLAETAQLGADAADRKGAL